MRGDRNGQLNLQQPEIWAVVSCVELQASVNIVDGIFENVCKQIVSPVTATIILEPVSHLSAGHACVNCQLKLDGCARERMQHIAGRPCLQQHDSSGPVVDPLVAGVHLIVIKKGSNMGHVQTCEVFTRDFTARPTFKSLVT